MTERINGRSGEHGHALLYLDALVHIVDPDAATCETLSVLFRLEGFQTTFSTDTVGFFAELERRPADMMLINLRLGADDGLAVLRRVRGMRHAMPVIMLANEPQVGPVVQAIKAGAVDVVAKPIDGEYLLRAARDALRQEPPRTPRSGRSGRLLEVRGFSQLTPREREVLQLVTSGQSNKEAGRELGISPRTIEVHRARVMEKLGARNTADLMRIVLAS